MKLPAITPEQIERETSRELHETIYAAFLGGGRALVPVLNGERNARQYEINGNYKRFWKERGFRLRTSRVPDGIECWIEPFQVAAVPPQEPSR